MGKGVFPIVFGLVSYQIRILMYRLMYPACPQSCRKHVSLMCILMYLKPLRAGFKVISVLNLFRLD